MAQQQQQQTTTGTATTTAPTTAPLTPEEQQEQDRMQRTTAAITQNLEQGQKQINGIVYTPRWSDPVWVQPNSLSLLFVYCLPGEFADSGQEILGGSELEVLESYSLAVTADLTGWLMIVQNENENARLPAAVGVICASDLNDAESRVLSPDEQTEINNLIQQFITIRTTQITNITQVINIINNVTTNGTTGPVTPPPTNETGGITPPPPTNETGGITTPPPTNETGGITTPPPTNETGGITTPPPTNETGGITPPGNDTGGTQPPRGSDIGGGILDNATVAGEGRGGETSSQGGVTPPPTNDTGTTPPTIDTGGIGGPLFPD
jgi:hypothetical protein